LAPVVLAVLVLVVVSVLLLVAVRVFPWAATLVPPEVEPAWVPVPDTVEFLIVSVGVGVV
jgi:hypothetical protein